MHIRESFCEFRFQVGAEVNVKSFSQVDWFGRIEYLRLVRHISESLILDEKRHLRLARIFIELRPQIKVLLELFVSYASSFDVQYTPRREAIFYILHQVLNFYIGLQLLHIYGWDISILLHQMREV